MKARVPGIALAALLAGCGPSSPASTAGRGVCVDDARQPAGCQTSWALVDPCRLVAAGQTLEAAVFLHACPSSSALGSGDTSGALARQSVSVEQPISPIRNLTQDIYGFSLLLRDAQCQVVAWGCTEADLSLATAIRTSVENWTGQNLCTAENGGGCAAGQRCVSGTCR